MFQEFIFVQFIDGNRLFVKRFQNTFCSSNLSRTPLMYASILVWPFDEFIPIKIQNIEAVTLPDNEMTWLLSPMFLSLFLLLFPFRNILMD